MSPPFTELDRASSSVGQRCPLRSRSLIALLLGRAAMSPPFTELDRAAQCGKMRDGDIVALPSSRALGFGPSTLDAGNGNSTQLRSKSTPATAIPRRCYCRTPTPAIRFAPDVIAVRRISSPPLFSPRRTFVSVITMISVLGVMLGVAVLIIVIAVMSGFDREWHSRILGVDAHLKVYKLAPTAKCLSMPTRMRQTDLENSKSQGRRPVYRRPGAAENRTGERQPEKYRPAPARPRFNLERAVSVFRPGYGGTYDLSGKGLLIGWELAESMHVQVGDRVAVYPPSTLEKWEKSKGQDAALPTDYQVRGIFDVGYSDFNSSIVVVSLEKAQEMYTLPDDMVHGLRITLDDPYQADAVGELIRKELGQGYRIITWMEERHDIFNALAVEKNMMFYLLFFIMIVAAFGIVNCQITFVVQKTCEIGILKALGATNPRCL